MSTDETVRLPLFPLRTVLFPGAALRLRIFERRYLDMVRDCARDGAGFGVCLILDGYEAGGPATPAATGTVARIEDFYTTPEGLLGIDARGHQRFHVERTRVRDNGLIVGDVRWLPDDRPQEVSPEHGLLATVLEHLLEQMKQQPQDRSRLDDAAWVGWRLAEFLPLALPDRQVLLQLDDACERLDRLADWLPRLQARD